MEGDSRLRGNDVGGARASLYGYIGIPAYAGMTWEVRDMT